jgi:hypothetical protein
MPFEKNDGPTPRHALAWKADDENNRFHFGRGHVAESSYNYIAAIEGYDS